MDVLQPIYCLADSQLLFRPPADAADAADAASLVEEIVGRLPVPPAHVCAAYVGASNGDDPAFFSIFDAAMAAAGVGERRMILSTFPADDREVLERAHLVVLAGGDPGRGWEVFERTGLGAAIAARYHAGAVLLGVSAGAVQLGWLTVPEGRSADDVSAADLVFTFRLVPAAVGAHEEADDWRSLGRLLAVSGLALPALGIPTGGGLVYHPDGTIEPVRFPVTELSIEGDTVRQSLLLPGAPAALPPAPEPQPTVH